MSIKNRKSPAVSDTVIRVGKQGTTYRQKTYKVHERAHGSTEEADSYYEEVILESSAAEVIDQINKRVKSPYYSMFLGIFTLFFIYCFSIIPLYLALPIFIALLVSTFVVYQSDVARKTTPLQYEFMDSYTESRFNLGMQSFQKLSNTQKSWRLKSKVAITDWKRNAGSNSSIVRHLSKIGKQNPYLLKVNVEIWGVDAGSVKLYLLPDRFFIFQDGVYSAIAYNELQTTLKELDYVEQEAVPSDAIKVGETWKFVRRDGGPDRRFNNNRKLPILRYGVISFNTQKLVAYIIISNYNFASSFVQLFSKILDSSGSSKAVGFSNKKEQKPTDGGQEPLPINKNILPEHLKPLKYAAIQKLELTTSQIAQTLQVSNSFITKNSVSFEYEGFRFTRSGKSGRQILWKVENLRANS